MTEITQADRDAAARAWAEDNDEPLDCYICEQIRAGYGDNSLDVIRFARHRMEAIAELTAENERLRNGLDAALNAIEFVRVRDGLMQDENELCNIARAALGETK